MPKYDSIRTTSNKRAASTFSDDELNRMRADTFGEMRNNHDNNVPKEIPVLTAHKSSSPTVSGFSDSELNAMRSEMRANKNASSGGLITAAPKKKEPIDPLSYFTKIERKEEPEATTPEIDAMTAELNEIISAGKREGRIPSDFKVGDRMEDKIIGNVNTATREALDWNASNMKKYGNALGTYYDAGWGEDGESREDYIRSYANSYSTVDSMTDNFDGVQISFTPIKNTSHGPEYIDYPHVRRYINGLISKANKSGTDWKNDPSVLLALDNPKNGGQGLLFGQNLNGAEVESHTIDEVNRLTDDIANARKRAQEEASKKQTLDYFEKKQASIPELAKDYSPIVPEGYVDPATMSDADFIDYALTDGVKLTKGQKARAQELYNAYNENFNEQLKAGKTYKEIFDQETAEKMARLGAKASTGSAIMSGITDAFSSFARPLGKAIGKGIDKITGTDEGSKAAESGWNYVDQVSADTTTQNPVAHGVGYGAGQMAQYAAVNSLADAAGLTGKLASGLGKAGLGEKAAGVTSNVLVGQGVDTLLDTIPTLKRNYDAGKYTNADGTTNTGAMVADAAKNQALNLGFNLGAEGVGALWNRVAAARAAKKAANAVDATKTAEQTADAVKAAEQTAQEVSTQKPGLTYAPEEDISTLMREQSVKLQPEETVSDLMNKWYAENPGQTPAGLVKAAPEVKPVPELTNATVDTVKNLPSDEELNAMRNSMVDDARISESTDDYVSLANDLEKDLAGKANSPEMERFWTAAIELIGNVNNDGTLKLGAREWAEQMRSLEDLYASIGGNVDVIEDAIRNITDLPPKTFAGAVREAPVSEVYKSLSDDEKGLLESRIESWYRTIRDAEKKYKGADFTRIKEAFDAYVDAVRTSLDVDVVEAAGKELLDARKELDTVLKKVDGYGKEFIYNKNAATNGAGWASGVTTNLGYIKSHPYYTPEQWAEILKDADEWADGRYYARPANVPEVTDASKNLVMAEDIGLGNKTGDIIDDVVPSLAKSVDDVADTVKAVNEIPEVAKSVSPTRNDNLLDELADSAREVDGTLQTAPIRERGYNSTLVDKTDAPQPIKDEFINDPMLYAQLSNATTKERADALLDLADLEKSYDAFNTILKDFDPAAVPLGYNLSKAYSAQGNSERAAQIIEDMAEKLTKSGQFSQAAVITMTKDDPLTALTYAKKQIAKINREGKAKFGDNWKNFTLTDDETKAFTKIEKGDTEAINNLYNQIGERIGKEYPVKFTGKMTEFRKLCMLLNPRTHIRNTVSNALLLPLRSASDRVSALGQNLAKLIDPNVKVTQSLTGGTKEQKAIADRIFDEKMLPQLEGSKYNELTGAIDRNKTVFKEGAIGNATKGAVTKVNDVLTDNSLLNRLTGGKLKEALEGASANMTGSLVEDLRQFDYWLLGEVEDNPFVKANFSNRLASYMKAQGINSIDDVPEAAISLAFDEALKATFKDDNGFTELLGGLKKTLNKHTGGVVGDVVFPFVKTPANIGMRAIEYSPMGVVTSAKKYLGQAKSARDVTKFIDDLSKSVTGTTAILIGYALAKAGIITGELSSNKREKQFQQEQGKQAYSIKIPGNVPGIGGTYVSYDWAQPAAVPLIFGAAINDVLQENAKKTKDTYDKLTTMTRAGGQIAATLIDSWVGLSPLQTLKELMGGNGSFTSSVGQAVEQTALDYPLSFIPTLMGATARAQDNVIRNTFSKDDAIGTMVNQAKAKIPGLSKTLPASYDAWGREKKRSEEGAQTLIAQYLNPGQLSYSNPTPIDSEIQSLFDVTQDTNVFPRKAGYSVTVNGENKPLSNVEQAEYQKTLGQYSYDLADSFITSDFYQTLDDERRGEILNKLYAFADDVTKNEMFGKDQNKDYTQMYNVYRDKGIEAVVDYLEMQEQSLGENGSVTKEKAIETLDNSGMSTADKAYWYDRINPNTNNPYNTLKVGDENRTVTADEMDSYNEQFSSYTKEIESLLSQSTVYQRSSDDQKKEYDKKYSGLADAITKQEMFGTDIPSSYEKLYGIYQERGFDGVVKYDDYRKSADKDGNGSLKKDEITSYLARLGLSRADKRYWFSKMSNAKNPY